MSSIGDSDGMTNLVAPVALLGSVSRTLSELPPGPVGVAFSGGPDSLALAILLIEARGERGGEIVLCNVEHNLRGAKVAEAEKRRITALAETLALPLRRRELEPGMVEETADRLGISVEAAARELRYELLSKLCEEEQLVALFTGHHRDDQLETVLLELIHGAPETAFGGMAKRRSQMLPGGREIPLLRPLLSVSRADLEELVDSRGVSPIRDPSNEERVYERNFLRHEVLPVLRKLRRSGEEGLLLSAARLRGMAEDITRRAEAIPFRRAHGALVVEAREFFSMPAVVRAAAIELQGRRRGISFPGRSRRFLEPLLEEPVQSRLLDPSESRVLLEGGSHRFSLLCGRLLWEHDIVPHRYFGYLHVVDSSPLELRWMGGVRTMTQSYEARRETVVSLPEDSLRPPVVVRSKRPGDRLVLEGEARLLKSLYDRHAIPQVVRENIPIIEDRSGILALPSDIFGFPRLQREGLSSAGATLEIRFFVHGDYV